MRSHPGHDPERCAGEHPRLLALLTDVLRSGDVFVDIGANTGFFAVPLARAVGSDGRVLAFEPAADATELLRAEARLHGVEHRIELHQIALSSEDGSGSLRADPRHPADSSKRSLFIGGPLVGEVPVRTFDGLVDAGEIELLHGVRAVKIDVEGAEMRVLEGMRDTLRRHRPQMLVAETIEEHLQRAGSEVAEVHAFMRALGYVAFDDPTNVEPLQLNAVFVPAGARGSQGGG
jgi:FkbM family methyltransferase